MPKSPWIALSLISAAVIAGCAPVPPPTAAPAPPPTAAPPVPAPAPAAPVTASSDQQFVNMALSAGATEIGLGRLAAGKAAGREVRAFAHREIADHTRVNARLNALAKRLKLTPAPPPDEPPPELLTVAGADFDKIYVPGQVKAHENAVALFEGEASNGQDPRMKHFARETALMLQHHLREIKEIAQKLGL